MHRKNSNELFYFHLDLQGSLMAISNMAGAVVEERNYDAWGRPRNPATLAYTLPNPFGGATSNYTLRGYTFHEHLDMFDLINMNGRMYDTHLGIFLNADPLIQDPTNVQNYNRNSYVLNNPLKYTDPSGYASKGFAMPTFGGGFEPGENEQTNSWNRWQNAKKSLRALAEDALSHEIEGGGGGVGVFFMALTSGTIIRNNNSAENFVSNYYSFRSMLNINSSLYNSINSDQGGGGVSLFFNGSTLDLMDNGFKVFSAPAVSGKPLADGSFDYSVARQKIGSIGPIPAGNYNINPKATQWWTNQSFMQRTAAIFIAGTWPGGLVSWGVARTWITPDGANVYGRSGFTIHGGFVPGSAGCIDLYGRELDFFRTLQNYGNLNSIPLQVKY